MRCVWLGILLGLLIPSLAPAGDATVPTRIRVVSEVWARYTEPDGSGLGWDLVRAVFGPAGVRVEAHSVPYTRAVGLVQRGEMDAWVGSYADEVRSGVLYPRWAYDADQICALGLAEQPEVRLDNLGSFHLAWLRGYAYERYLPNLKHYRVIQRRDGILSMLTLRHADLFIDARPELEDVLVHARDPSAFRVSCLTTLPLYLGFADTANGKALAHLFDRRMEELVASGELRPIFERWHYPYPFQEGAHATTP